MKKTKKKKNCFGRSRNIVEKGENKFQKLYFSGLLKSKDYVIKVSERL